MIKKSLATNFLFVISLIIFTLSFISCEKKTNSKVVLENNDIELNVTSVLLDNPDSQRSNSMENDDSMISEISIKAVSNKKFSPIAIGEEIIVTTNEGLVYKIGNTDFYANEIFYAEDKEFFNIWDKAILIPELKDIISVYAGYDSYYAIDKDTNLWVWGNNEFGQLVFEKPYFIEKPTKVEKISNIRFLYAYGGGAYLLFDDGTVECYGTNRKYFNFVDKDAMTNVKDIRFRILLKEDGALYSFPYIVEEGEDPKPYVLKKLDLKDRVVKIYEGSRGYSFARTEDGSIYIFDEYGLAYETLEKIDIIPQIVEMSEYGQAYINSEGRIISALGTELKHPLIKDIIYIADANKSLNPNTFYHSAIVLKSDGTIYQYTLNYDGSYINVGPIKNIDNVGPCSPLYKGQYIGNENTKGFSDFEGIDAQ